MSSGKLAAGADAGKQDAPSADIKLSFYVDDKMQYNDLKELDKNNPPTFPYTVGGVTYKLEADYTKALLAKFYDDAAAAKADTATEEGKYTVWFYSQGDDDHNDSKIGQVNVTIAKNANDTVPADNSKPTEGSDVDNASNNESTPAKEDVVPPNTGYNGTTTVTFFLLGAVVLLAAATVYTKKKSK